MCAFCSTSSTVVPRSRMSAMTRNTCCTISGARPSDGSSSSSRRGLDMRPRAIATICCWPPESVQPSASANGLDLRKDREHLVDVGLELAARHAAPVGAAEHDVLLDRQARKDAPAFRHMGDAKARRWLPGACRAISTRRRSAASRTAASSGPRSFAASCSCRRRWRPAGPRSRLPRRAATGLAAPRPCHRRPTTLVQFKQRHGRHLVRDRPR